jgi:hypothetical protein
MSERRENSVLFSLKELRNIEDGRVKKEREDADARLEAERAAKAATERAAREAEERQRRDEDDRLQRIEDEKEGRVREDQIRLQEAERRARVEGEVRLQEERLRLEAHAKTVHKSPLKAILGVTAVLVVIAGALGSKMYNDHQAELNAERANSARLEAEAKAAKVEFQARLDKIQNEMNDKLARAKTDEEKARIRAEAAQQRAAAASTRTSHSHGSSKTESAPSTPTYHPIQKRTMTDNPLEGIDTK